VFGGQDEAHPQVLVKGAQRRCRCRVDWPLPDQVIDTAKVTA
jgi:hypothetical protein